MDKDIRTPNLDQLPAAGSWFIAAPLKITAADGSPCRAAALVPNS